MANSGSDFGFNSSAAEVEEKSWHLLTVLLRIGHAVYPEHLASQCRLFAASPDFIRYVTLLPASPLSLTDNGLVTPSTAASVALVKLLSFKWPDSQPYGSRKRKLLFSSTEGERYHKRLAISSGVQETSLESIADAAKDMMRGNFCATRFESQHIDGGKSITSLLIDTNGLGHTPLKLEHMHRKVENDASTSLFHGEIYGSMINASYSLFMARSDFNIPKAVIDRFMQCNLFVNLALPTSFQDSSLCSEGAVGSIKFGKTMDYFDTVRHCYSEQNISHPVDDGGNTWKDPITEINEDEKVEDDSKKSLIDPGTDREKEDVAKMVNPAPCEKELIIDLEPKNRIHALNLENNDTVRTIRTPSTNKISHPPSNPLLKYSRILKGGQKKNLHPKPQILTESLACNKFGNAPNIVDQRINDQKFTARHKVKQIHKENMVDSISTTPKVEKKAYPSFENYSIEEEEGSGGYGTVYRAQRITDGKRFAIKCPHNNAHKNHVNNERNMLERFGGRNFIIKFEGSFKSGSSDCFVLEHVEHDRPEVLKKEIDVNQLQWYGYCMFRALAYLHKEGVVHRDVKPGNFLFSQKLNKGYLIDFNLAMDLKQKYNIGSKSKPSLDASKDINLPSGSAPLVQDKSLRGRKYTELNRHAKQKAYAGPLKNCPDKVGVNVLRAQGTDGSGITSAKDVTSTRTASAERLREPLPFRGRKELISLVQNSMLSANNSSIKVPSSQRKRVTAPSGKVDGKIVYLTPMPLHSSAVAAGLLRSKGDGKHKREGSCVGTKGFRAPEVLLRSQFQGNKVDIWSAGVTLLYMMIGKTPFTGEPEQNIKEIAKLRGSEELWEVAKLHDRELSFPAELFDDRYLQSWNLESWCKIHTKRPEFLEQIPKSLFDLVDKCLTVNPRNRISVEEVLRHEFFASCNEIMRKQRMIRRGLTLNTAASTKMTSIP